MKAKRLALGLWIGTIAYWPLQVLVARSWPEPYSIRDNLISDLGAVTCTEVCSPSHALMNATFIGVGGATAIGAAILGRQAAGSTARGGYVLVALSGLCTIAVGLLPLDRASTAHTISAQAHFGLQVAGMIALAVAYRHSRPGLATWSAAATVVSIVGGIAFVSEGYWGLGAGYSERIALDTLNVWTIGAAIGLARSTSVR